MERLGVLKTCQIAVSKPNRNSLWRFGSAKASSERQSKAVLRVLRVLRGAENVPDSSFEAQ